MKKALKIIVLVLFLVFIAIQFVRPDFTNPAIVAGQSLAETTQVPDDVQKILTRSCGDCHSSATVYPWYSKIQPSAQFLAGHIRDGRKQLNFSEWGTYENRRRKSKLGEICEQVEGREMPLPSYLWIHWNAKLSDDEIKKVCDWTDAEAAKISAAQGSN
ncbi:MAG: heme-binding domain-containing protein [Pyrinomonadaceae bacterium]